MNLIGLIGNAGAGKNTFAEEFHYYKFYEYSFAAPLKAACAQLFGISEYYFNNQEEKNQKHPYWNVSPREILQFVGTELVRNHLGELLGSESSAFWIERLKLQLIHDFDSPQDVRAVITDCRFKDEVDYILSNGGKIIHLTRPSCDGNVGIQSHSSEYLARNFRTLYSPTDSILFVDNDGTLDQLKIKAHQIAHTL